MSAHFVTGRGGILGGEKHGQKAVYAGQIGLLVSDTFVHVACAHSCTRPLWGEGSGSCPYALTHFNALLLKYYLMLQGT